MEDLEKVRDVFLDTELDDDVLEDNRRQIADWERGLVSSEAMASWQEHDITKGIMVKVKEEYKEISTSLMQNRNLTEAQRQAIYAKQDAMRWLISLNNKDAKQELEAINGEIKKALNTT